jgi:hypothetical protein
MKIITCTNCCQPTEIINFKQQFKKIAYVHMDLRDFALVTSKIFGYCPFCGKINELDMVLEMATQIENKLDGPKDPKI